MRAIDHTSHEGYQSLLACALTAYTLSGQSEQRVPPAPITMLERSSCLGGQTRSLLIQPHERHLVTSFIGVCFRVNLGAVFLGKPSARTIL